VDYKNITWPKMSPAISGLVASHHGGSVNPMPATLSAAAPSESLVISVGAHNVHKHPASTAIAEHASLGWAMPPRTTLTRKPWPTAASTTKIGAVLVKLNPLDSPPAFECECIHDGFLGTSQ